MNQLIQALALLTAALYFSACSTVPAPTNPHDIDAIVVTYSPSGNMEAEDLERIEITDAATIDRWVEALDAVPEMPARGIRFIRFAPPISQHRVELRKDGEVVRVARMRSGQLDVAAHEGWAFYSGEDKAFTALVNAAVPGS